MAKKTWTGHRARPANRAKTWGKKHRDTRKERREARRDLKGSRFALIVPIKFKRDSSTELYRNYQPSRKV